MAALGVNIDHVATVRQARRTYEPNVGWAAVEAQLGGADGITFHLRQDRRHIIDSDLPVLRSLTHVKLNMEMSLSEEVVQLALATKPDQATLVPENRQEITTEGGLDVAGQLKRVAEVTERLHQAGIIVSAFIDPDPEQVLASSQARCQAVELHTGQYANARGESAVEDALAQLQTALRVGLEQHLVVHAGHGLTYTNVQPVAAMAGFAEFNIGHSIISRAIFVGLRQAVAEMKALVAGGADAI